MHRLGIVALLLTIVMPTVALAVNPDEMLKDPKLEARARVISGELRCMVCQNQSIDDSEAPLAHDLRLLVRDRLVKGDTNQQVLDYLVARYGEFVLLKPRFEPQNLLLWGLPPFALVAGAIALFIGARRRQPKDAEPTLTADERKKIASLIGSQTE